MQGFVEARVFDAKGLGDEPFLAACREKRLEAFLQTLPLVQHAKPQSNLLFDMWAATTFARAFPGVPGLPSYWYHGSLTGQGAFATVLLRTTATEPSYTESSGTGASPVSPGVDTVDTTYGGKRFIEDDAEAHRIYKDPDGREVLWFVSRFLWLPSQGNLVDIKSFSARWSENADSTASEQRGFVSRIRFKDSGGVPITLQKSLAQSLLIEYRYRLIAV